MGIFDRFKKNTDTLSMTSPVKGEVMNITQVADPVFSSQALGDGVGIKPESMQLYSPIAGEIVSVFPTKHAVGIKSIEGSVELLIHIGIETVNLNGEGFALSINQGDQVKQGDLLGEVDFSMIEAKGYDPTFMVILTNSADFSEIRCLEGAKESGDEIMTFKSTKEGK